MRVCKDCRAVGVTTNRPAPHPGPRCASHNRATVKARKKHRHSQYVQNNFGLPEGVYDLLYEFQERKCYICQRATGATKRLAVDHDHAHCNGPTSCGECVRGLLCSNCNSTLAHARDDEKFFLRAILYLRRSPFQAMMDKQT